MQPGPSSRRTASLSDERRNFIEHWIKESWDADRPHHRDRPTIPAARYGERLAAARDLAAEAGFAAILVGVGADMRYLAGYPAMPLERLTMLVIPTAGDVALVAPRLEATPARSCPPAAAGLLPVVTWDETDDPHALVATMVRDDRRVAGRGPPDRRVRRPPGAASAAPPGALAGARFELASPILGRLRIVKDQDEIALLTEAAHAADRVVAQIAAGRLVGRTEADVAREVRERLIAEGHDEATFAIVASGPNSASPHHEASERVIAAGEPIVLDIGGTIDGYGSDITRTLWVTGGDPAKGPDERFRHLFGVLRSAQAALDGRGPAGCQPPRRSTPPRAPRSRPRATARRSSTGPATGSASRVTRTRTSSPATASRSRPGMAFSIEPGIYLDGPTARGSRTSCCAGRTARSRSTRPRASCTSSTADPTAGAARPRLARPGGRMNGTLRYHRATGRARCGPPKPTET